MKLFDVPLHCNCVQQAKDLTLSESERIALALKEEPIAWIDQANIEIQPSFRETEYRLLLRLFC